MAVVAAAAVVYVCLARSSVAVAPLLAVNRVVVSQLVAVYWLGLVNQLVPANLSMLRDVPCLEVAHLNLQMMQLTRMERVADEQLGKLQEVTPSAGSTASLRPPE